jgi:transcriptional regulator with XRE-family HTH domain
MANSTIERIAAALLAMPRADWEALATRSGVPRSTIEKIAYGITSNPSFDTIERLSGALNGRGVAA